MTHKRTLRDFANAIIVELDTLSLDQYEEIKLIEQFMEYKLHKSMQEYGYLD